MPIRCSTGKARYRVRTYNSGKRVRLAFCGKKVVEAKSYFIQEEGGAKNMKRRKMSVAAKRRAAKKAWSTRRRKYGRNGVRG